MTTIVVADPATQIENQNPDPAIEADESVPAKYRGKSATEIIEIARNLESELGRKNNEVGTLRKLTDQALGFAQNARVVPDNQTKPKSRPELTSEDLLANPEKSVTELAIEAADNRVKDTEQRQANLEAQIALDRFQRKHPDFTDTIQTDEFKTWLGSSTHRQRLAYRAAQNDFDAADELLGLYGETKQKPDDEKNAGNAPIDQAKKAGLAKRGGSSAAGVGTSSDGKKIYSRAELIEMRINKPDEFEARYTTEFLPAYREKRVR